MPPDSTIVEIEDPSSIKRRLILRDSVTFITLVSITVVLFLITLFLFRSFTEHRADLATRWSDRGKAAISSGHPEQAIVALRTALTYAPGRRDYELLLAQALADAGHSEEAYNYFLGLWETEPGNGIINLSLARLAAHRSDPQAAIDYYHAAIYGTWEGDATLRRRSARIELANYLLSLKNPSAARAELLIASGNAPDDLPLTLTVAQKLEQSGFPRDALSLYQKALTLNPKEPSALAAAGRLEYASGDFEAARHSLEEAVAVDEKNVAAKALLEQTERLLALAPAKSLPDKVRVARILNARAIARKRFDACNAQRGAATGPTAPLAMLSAAWQSKSATSSAQQLLADNEQQDAAFRLILDTEFETSQICGQPTGDDALLLLIARSPRAMEP